VAGARERQIWGAQAERRASSPNRRNRDCPWPVLRGRSGVEGARGGERGGSEGPRMGDGEDVATGEGQRVPPSNCKACRRCGERRALPEGIPKGWLDRGRNGRGVTRPESGGYRRMNGKAECGGYKPRGRGHDAALGRRCRLRLAGPLRRDHGQRPARMAQRRERATHARQC
jgi:hypothetical protein